MGGWPDAIGYGNGDAPVITFSFGPPPPNYDPIYMGYMLLNLTQSFNETVSEKSPSQRVLLQSPDKTIYSLTVDNAGNLKVSKVG